MQVTPSHKSTQTAIPSPDGQHIVSVNGSMLEVRRTSTLSIVHSVNLSSRPSSRFVCLRWSPITKSGTSDRILLAQEDSVHVWDIHDHDWSATLDNGSGGMGKIANAEFGSDDCELLTWSAFGAEVTIWNLWTGKSITIKDPKFSTKGHGWRKTGRSGVFALISRPATQDVLTLHAAPSYQPIRSITLPSVDAQGLKWSPNGRWLAVWDASAMGYKVFIYTADGSLFRTYSGDYFDDELQGLGVKSVEWSPDGNFLAIGGYERTITLLSTTTFSPAVQLSHTNNIHLSHGTIWREMMSASPIDRRFEPTTGMVQAAVPTTSCASELLTKTGVSIAGFSADGSYLATKDDSVPTAVWIWDLSSLCCKAVLLLHHVVKRFSWHPTDPDMLLIQCAQEVPLLYGWRAAENLPYVMSVPHEAALSGKADASWLRTRLGRAPVAIFGDANAFVLVYPDGPNETPSPELNAQNGIADDDESLFDIVSSKGHDDQEYAVQNGMAEDTFRFRHGIGAH